MSGKTLVSLSNLKFPLIMVSALSLAACDENGSAEIILGSNRRGDKVIQVRLVAEKKFIPKATSTAH